MKKFLMSVMVLMAGVTCFAEQGDKAIGVNFYDNPKFEGNGVGGGLFFRYSFSDHFRAKINANYFKFSSIGALDATVDADWAFTLSDKFVAYPVISVGVLHCESTEFQAAFGAGAEYLINEHWSIGAQFKAQYITNTDGVGAPISVGVSYTF